MRGVEIRRAVPGDEEGVFSVETLSFSDPWSLESFQEELTTNKAAVYVVACEEGKTIGFAGLWVVGPEGYITNIAIHPDYRGRGIGGRLVEDLMERTEGIGVRRYTLEVRPSNKNALGLYRKLGFEEAGRRPGYYRNPWEDAVIMWRGTERK